jgi:hypothetical protein
VVPLLACGVVVWLLSQATRAEFSAVATMLAVATVLYRFRRPRPLVTPVTDVAASAE